MTSLQGQTVQNAAATSNTPAGQTALTNATRYVLAGLRIALGWIFLWAFLDKVFGWGFATPAKNAWIDGGNPTLGFLKNGAEGPFAGFYHAIAGATLTNWAFMLALLAVGVALISGAGIRLAAIGGGLLLIMMWTVVLPPSNNPFMDDHLIYAGVLAVLALTNAGDTLGIGRLWGATGLVRRLPILK
jgi:thiosulfate dehydrogenase (quinone) large subunit